jgi:hypothetical protein
MASRIGSDRDWPQQADIASQTSSSRGVSLIATVAQSIRYRLSSMQAKGKAAALLALVAALLVCLVLPSSSVADPLPIASLSPANGSTQTPGYRVPFELVSSSSTLIGVKVEVATQNVPGQDGSLADDFQKDTVFLTKSDAYPTTYRGTSTGYGGGWESTPGTYYWQVSASEFINEAPYVRKYLGPVYTITIGYPPPPPPVAEPTPSAIAPLTLSELYAAVKGIIRRETGKPGRHLSSKCHKKSTYTATCSASWSTSTRFTASTYLYSGAFGFVAKATKLNFTFLGLRAQYGCVRRHHATKPCAHRVRWH